VPQLSRDSEASVAFILELGLALHRFGTPANRLEDALAQVAGRLGIPARFFSSPTALMAAFGPPERQRTSLIRVDPGEVDLDRLGRLYALADDVADGRVGIEEGTASVREILAKDHATGPALTIAAFAVASGAAARFFGGGLPEVAVAVAIGGANGLLALLLGRAENGTPLFPVAASFLAAFAAVGAAHVAALHASLCALAGVIVLVPGLTLTVGLNEIATRHLASGTTRLTAAAVVFLEIGFGVVVGERSATALWGEAAAVAPVPLPAWTEYAALLAAGLAFGVLFRAPWRGLPWVIAAAALAYAGARIGSLTVGPEVGASFGAFVLGTAGNLYGRLLRRPSLTLIVPGLLMLVPGSLGFRSLAAMIEHDTLTGLETAFAMALVGISIVVGLLVANAVVAPRRML